MRIQHNIMAMNAYRNYNTNTSALSKNLEKLSSGYKINRAGDDAAGLAISEKMRAQITGLNAAQKNVKDGISLVKTAEGAMQEIQDMLNRMDYLATQSANGTYDNEVDRANLQKEVVALKSEINRIADSANFNGIKLLDGKNAMATSIAALGELDESAMIDGTKPTAGGKALINVTLDDLAGTGGKAVAIDAANTFDGVNPTPAVKAKVEITADATFNGTAADAAALGAKTADGQDLKDLFTLKVDGTATDWTDNTAFAVGAKIELEAKVGGELSATAKTDLDTLVGAAGTVTNGKDEGAAGPAKETSYEIKLDLTKLEGGQYLELNGKKITFSLKDASDTDATNAKVNINGLDFTDTTDQTTFKDDLEAALKAQHTAFGTGTNASTTVEIDANGVATIKMQAADSTGDAGNLGEIRFTTNDGQDPVVAGSYKYNKYEAPAAAAAGKHAQVTYSGEELKDLKAGTTLKIGDIEIEVVADGTNAADMKSNQITETDAANATKLAQVIENQKGFNFGKVTYDGTNGTLTITAKDGGADQLDALKTNTAVSVSAPVAEADKKAAAGTGGLDIVFGTTTVNDLKNHELTMGTTTVKLGDLFNIKVTDKTGAPITDANAITDGASISFEAKQTGKLSQEVMDAISYTGKASTEVRPGWDEGTNGAGNNTHYELNISTDNNKLAGGASFSFGTGSNAKTFDITYDDVETDNGTVTNPDKGTEVSGGRIKINLSSSMTDQEKADAIKQAVADNMTAFNVKTTVSNDSIKLEATAKNAAPDTNYGGVRFSSAGGAFSDGVYNAYNAFDGGTAGTYAQVSYDFDPSKLKAGDKLTIGGTTITVGEKDSSEVDENGNVSITIAEDRAQKASDLISAFESAGFQKGQMKIENGKLTITDGQEAGRTAEELAKDLNVSISSTTRALTSGGLTLQIGDTSDIYNQLTVSIGDMHTKALGIDGIDIGNQAGASAAIQTIRNAINQVSSVRGDLGATQNRLEHTANNLSVMAENIQDAESTIRDTDVAEEMMSYVKNNILVQSAQAMLAQANQVPQGVLQLLG